ncbi:hypothetical protein ACX9R5_04305 [Rathayibacter sp. CAU 1779]
MSVVPRSPGYLHGYVIAFPPQQRIHCTIALAPVGDGSQTEHVFTCAFPAGMSDEEIASWVAVGMREGWAMTIERLMA